eukprot:6213734-Pleurochrysis_carterae.AAC.3
MKKPEELSCAHVHEVRNHATLWIFYHDAQSKQRVISQRLSFSAVLRGNDWLLWTRSNDNFVRSREHHYPAGTRERCNKKVSKRRRRSSPRQSQEIGQCCDHAASKELSGEIGRRMPKATRRATVGVRDNSCHGQDK